MNRYRDYNILIRRLDEAKDKVEQNNKNKKSVYYQRLDGSLRICYEEYLDRIGIKGGR